MSSTSQLYYLYVQAGKGEVFKSTGSGKAISSRQLHEKKIKKGAALDFHKESWGQVHGQVIRRVTTATVKKR